MESKRAPVQGWAAGIPWDLHLEAYSAYCKKYGPQQALIEGGCRGGFATGELDMFIPGWREKISALTAAKNRIRELEGLLRHFRSHVDIVQHEVRWCYALVDQVDIALASQSDAEVKVCKYCKGTGEYLSDPLGCICGKRVQSDRGDECG
jgi:hypothetical protein